MNKRNKIELHIITAKVTQSMAVYCYKTVKMFFNQLLVLCSILFNFSPTYTITKPEKLLENYQKHVLDWNLNIK